MEKLRKLDNLWLGFILGIVVPIITLTIVYLYTFDGYSVKEFIEFLKKMRVISKLFSLCLLPNLGVFFLFIWPDFLKGAKGTLFATILVAFVVIVIQFLTVGI